MANGVRTGSAKMEILESAIRIHPKGCCGLTGAGGSGGVGGQHGNYGFIETGVNETQLPTFNAHVGSDGMKGKNSRTCITKALDIKCKTHHTRTQYRTDYIHHFTHMESRTSPRCPDRYASRTTSTHTRSPVEPLNLTPTVIQYKMFLRDIMKNSMLAKTIRKTYEAIESNADIKQLFTVDDLAVEVNALETQFYQLNEYVDVLPFYENLMKRIEYSYLPNMATLTSIDQNVLIKLYATLLIKLASLRSSHKSNLIIDIENFLATIETDIENLDEAGRIRTIKQQRNNYIDDLSGKVIEAMDFIQNGIQPEIEILFTRLDSEMQQVIEQTVSLRVKSEREIRKKQEHAIKIRRNANIRKALGVAEMLTHMASFLGPKGKMVAGLAFPGIELTKLTLSDPKINKNAVPVSVKNLINSFEENDKETINGIGDELTKLIDSLTNVTEERYNFVNELNHFQLQVSSIKSKTPLEHNKIGELLEKFIEFVLEKQRELASNNTDIVQRLRKTANALAVIATSCSIYNQFSANDESLDQIGEALIGDQNTRIALMALEDKMYAELLPMATALHGSLDAVQLDLGSKSSVALDVQKLRIRHTLRSTMKQLSDSISGFKNEYGVENCLVRIEESFNLVINIYDRIQNYQDQTKLVNLLSDLHLASNENSNVAGVLSDILNESQFNLRANIILSQYYRAVNGFKQAVFPFAATFMSDYQLPVTFSADRNMNTVVANAIRLVKSLRESINDLHTVVHENDALIYRTQFDNSIGARGPFYVWSHDEVRDKVDDLFKGKKIYLLADVGRSFRSNAVKFNIIDLVLQSNNQIANTELQQILRTSFHVTLTHMGESSYRCNNQFYKISSPSVNISYSFGGDKYAPIDKNEVYDKLSSGIPLLSPYTVWIIQLTVNAASTSYNFNLLKRFADSVHIELHGKGQYVSDGATVCNSDLEKYYLLKSAQ